MEAVRQDEAAEQPSLEAVAVHLHEAAAIHRSEALLEDSDQKVVGRHHQRSRVLEQGEHGARRGSPAGRRDLVCRFRNFSHYCEENER